MHGDRVVRLESEVGGHGQGRDMKGFCKEVDRNYGSMNSLTMSILTQCIIISLVNNNNKPHVSVNNKPTLRGILKLDILKRTSQRFCGLTFADDDGNTGGRIGEGIVLEGFGDALVRSGFSGDW
jgi:hypothetical protein